MTLSIHKNVMSMVDMWKKSTDHWSNNDSGIQQGKTKVFTEKHVTVPLKIPHGQDWDWNPGVCGNRLAINYLSHSIAMMSWRPQHLARYRIKLHSFPTVILLTVIWDMTLCSLVDNYICMFQTKQLPPPSTLETEAQYIRHDYPTNYNVLHLRRSC
jgi:hypothetical protein